MKGLSVAGLSVNYGDVVALDGVTFEVTAGKVCGLIGMNGSGKSTLFKAIMGLLRPSAGTVSILGESPETARRTGLVGYVPQSEDVDWTFPLSVRDVVLTGRYGKLGWTRRAGKVDREAVDTALDRVGLTDLQHRRIGALSGGQRKRAFVARCIAQQAHLLLLDEPFAGVDKVSEAALVSLLRELAADGATVLVSTHDLHALPALADEALLLQRRILLRGDPATVLLPENLALAFGLDPPVGPGSPVGPDAQGGSS